MHPHIAKAVLYGSRAKGTYKEGSDIDVCLFGDAEPHNGLSHNELAMLYSELDALDLPYTFDLSLFQSMEHVPLKEHIARAGVLLYTRA